MQDKRSVTVLAIFSGGILNRVTCVIIDMYLATLFGVSPYISIFMLSFRIFQVIKRMLTENGMQMMVVVPCLQAMKRVSKKSAFYFLLRFGINSFLYQIIVLIGIEAALFSLEGSNMWGWNFSDLSKCLRIILLSIPVISLYMIFSAILQSDNKFAVTSFAPAVFNVSWLGGLLIIKRLYGYLDHVSMSIMLLIAVVIQCLFISGFSIKILLDWSKYKEAKKVPDLNMSKMLIMGIIGLGVTQINSLVDTVFCQMSDPSGPAYMWYSVRTIVPLTGLIGSALAGSFIPELSKKYDASRIAESDRMVEKIFMKSFFITLPFVGMLVCIITSVFSILFLHGNFNDYALMETVKCSIAFAIALPFSVGARALYSKYFAQRRLHITLFISLISVILNCGLNYVFVFIFNKGAAFIAVATAISAFVQMIISYYRFYVDASHKSNVYKHVDKMFSMTIITLLSSAITITFSGRYLGDGTLFIITGRYFPAHKEEIFSRVLGLFISLGLYCLVFSGISYATGLHKYMSSIIRSLMSNKHKKRTSDSAKIISSESIVKYD